MYMWHQLVCRYSSVVRRQIFELKIRVQIPVQPFAHGTNDWLFDYFQKPFYLLLSVFLKNKCVVEIYLQCTDAVNLDRVAIRGYFFKSFTAFNLYRKPPAFNRNGQQVNRPKKPAVRIESCNLLA